MWCEMDSRCVCVCVCVCICVCVCACMHVCVCVVQCSDLLSLLFQESVSPDIEITASGQSAESLFCSCYLCS